MQDPLQPQLLRFKTSSMVRRVGLVRLEERQKEGARVSWLSWGQIGIVRARQIEITEMKGSSNPLEAIRVSATDLPSLPVNSSP